MFLKKTLFGLFSRIKTTLFLGLLKIMLALATMPVTGCWQLRHKPVLFLPLPGPYATVHIGPVWLHNFPSKGLVANEQRKNREGGKYAYQHGDCQLGFVVNKDSIPTKGLLAV